MGVPSYYRWLSAKYPKIIKDAVEESGLETGTLLRIQYNPDTTRQNITDMLTIPRPGNSKRMQ